MKTVEINLYQFAELSEKAKQRAINDWRQTSNEAGDYLYFFNDDCIEHLKELGFTNPTVQYSLSYSQGDGLSFSAEGYNNLTDLFIEVLGAHHAKMAEFLASNCTLEIKGNTGRYTYASRSDIDLYTDLTSALVVETTNVDNAIEAVQSKLTDIYMTACKEMEDRGYKELENEQSDEYISETLISNEYDFTEDGKRY